MSSSQSADETAVITGASRGIGYELAKQFAADGYDMVLIARSEEQLQTVGKELETTHGINTSVIVSDLSASDAANTVYERIQSQTRVIDVLVNNAGFGIYGEFVDTKLSEEMNLIHLHILTVTKLTKLIARDMVTRNHGYILNTASTAGFAPLPKSAVYSAAKHYQRSFSEALAEELADEGVTVTALCPGETDTGFMSRGNYEETGFKKEELMDPTTVAQAGYDGLMNKERIVIPGIKHKIRTFLRRILPRKTYVKAAGNSLEQR